MARPTAFLIFLNIIIICMLSWSNAQRNATTVSSSTARSMVGPILFPTVIPLNQWDSSRNSQNCKVAYTVGYGYRRVYHWADSLEEKRKGNRTVVSSATLNFRVRAFSDAHIMLSMTSNPANGEPVYEIVLGGGRNSFSSIRRLRQTGTNKVFQSTPNIMSPTELRGFWIRVSSDGTIEVGIAIEGEELALMGWRDPQPLSIHYFAFCTWNGVVGKWEYDCPGHQASQGNSKGNKNCTNTDTQQEGDNDEEVEQPITWTQRLRRDLLSQYDPYARPTTDHNKITSVFMHLASRHIDIDEHKNMITLHGTMSMYWIDDKLVWNPNQYGNLSNLHTASHEIWMPELLLYNAADGLGDTLFNNEATRATVQHDGAVTWAPQVRLQALCTLHMANWPMDRQTCLFQLGVWSHGPFVKLDLWENGSALEIQHTGSQWIVEDVSAFPGIESFYDKNFKISPSLLNAINDFSDQDNSAEISLMSIFWLQVTVQRMSRIYYTLLLTPLTMICIQMIASFWVSPLDYSRLILCEINLLLMLLLLITIGFTLPASSDTVPHMIKLYQSGLLVATCSILITVLVISLSQHKFTKPPPSIISQKLDGALGLILLLQPPSKGNDVAQQYGELEDTKYAQQDCNDETSILPAIVKIEDQWLRLAIAIDRFVSITYIIFLAFVLI